MPRCISAVPWRGSASWLLEAPATICAFNWGMVLSLRMAPIAQGAKTSTSRPKIASAPTTVAPSSCRARVELLLVDIAHPQAGTGLFELPGEVETDVAHALHRHPQAIERITTELFPNTAARMPTKVP